jgi:hypothetical protein
MAGIINDVFRLQKALQKTRIKLYNTILCHLQLLYGSENCNILAGEARRITTTQMKYIRQTTG